MPDHPMTPDPFREALDALVDATYCSALADERGGQDEKVAWQERYAAARAEVERLYAARVGEEMEVERLFLRYGEGHGICFAEDDDRFAPGDRVFVTKGEAA